MCKSDRQGIDNLFLHCVVAGELWDFISLSWASVG